MAKKIGFIGLGNIGRGICKNLILAGHSVTVNDVNAQAMEQFRGKAALVDSPAEVLRASDIVFFSLPDSEIVEGIMEQFFKKGLEGKTIVDTSTSYPLSTKKLAKRTEELGGRYVDAPLLAGPAEAEAGTLEIVVGGHREDFERLTEVFYAYCSKYSYIGESGSGHLAKLAINYIGGMYSFGLAQTFPVMEALGIAPKDLYEIFDCEPLANGVFRFYGKKYAERNHHLDFALKLCMKDFRYVKQLHDDLGVEGFILDGMLKLGNLALEMADPDTVADTSFVGEVMYRLLEEK